MNVAADELYGLLNEEVFQLLTGDGGWDVEQFRRWATALMLQQLVSVSGPRDDPPRSNAP